MKHYVKVAMPRGATPSPDDVEMLEVIFSAIAGLREDEGEHWRDEILALESEGWKVHWGLTWVAEARRGECVERAHGKTRDEAFEQLRQLTMLDTVEGCP